MKHALFASQRKDPLDMITVKTEIQRHKHENTKVYTSQLKKTVLCGI